MSTKGKTWRRRKRERVSEILASAVEEFSRGTFATITMDHIARRAGVTKGTIYLYYGSKRELFRAVQKE